MWPVAIHNQSNRNQSGWQSFFIRKVINTSSHRRKSSSSSNKAILPKQSPQIIEQAHHGHKSRSKLQSKHGLKQNAHSPSAGARSTFQRALAPHLMPQNKPQNEPKKKQKRRSTYQQLYIKYIGIRTKQAMDPLTA